jgi:hypothetical protein
LFREAGVDRSFLYRHHDLRAQIHARPAYPGADHSDGEWHDFIGAGPIEAHAADDAERHALEFLGDDAHLWTSRPA